MAINGVMALDYIEVQKRHPKGKAVEADLANEYKQLKSEIKPHYPYAPKAEKMSYGSKGKVFET